VIKLRRMRWAGHVAYMGKGEVHTGLLWGKRPLGKPRRRWKVILNFNFEMWDGEHGLDWSGSG
jgi:hypothetical protein